MDERAYVLLSYTLQLVAGGVLAAVFLASGRGYGRRLLVLWGAAWLLFTLSALGAGVGYWAYTVDVAPGSTARILAALLNTSARLAFLTLLAGGAVELLRGRPVSNRALVGAAVVAAVVGGIASVASASMGPSDRVLLRLYLPNALSAGAAVLAGYAVWRRGRAPQGLGRLLLAVTLTLWAVSQLQPIPGFPFAITSPVSGFLQLTALFLVAVSAVLWFLEDERARALAARDQIDAAREDLSRRLALEADLAEISTAFIDADPDEVDRAIDVALGILAGHLGARRASLLVRKAGWARSGGRFRVRNEWMREGPEVGEGPGGGAWPPPTPDGDDLPWDLDALMNGEVSVHPDGEGPGPRTLAIPCRVGGRLAGVLVFELAGVAPALSTAGAPVSHPGPYRLAGEIFAALLSRLDALQLVASHEERLRTAFRAFPGAVSLARLEDGLFLEVNQGCQTLLGYTRDEMVGRTSRELGVWPDPEQRRRLVDTLRNAGRVRDMEFDFRTRDGEVLNVLLTAELVEVDGDLCMLAAARDRTEVLQLQDRLRKVERLEAVGRLAGGVAHDFNNLLTVIGGQAELMLHTEGADPETVAMAREILEANDRGRDLVKSLLEFAREGGQHPSDLELGELVENLSGLARRLTGPARELTLVADGQAWTRCDRTQAEQVIMNLVLNATHATAPGGRITVATRLERLDEPHEWRDVRIPPGEWALLEVRDTGTGIPEDVLPSIFDPFFTTKGVGEGTGLGLSTVYGIVVEADGYVTVDTALGRGTTFRVFLPAVSPPPAPGPDGEPSAAGRGVDVWEGG